MKLPGGPPRFVTLTAAADRLKSNRPNGSTVEIAQVDELAVSVLDRISEPAVHDVPMTPRLASTGSGDEYEIIPVRKQAAFGSGKWVFRIHVYSGLPLLHEVEERAGERRC